MSSDDIKNQTAEDAALGVIEAARCIRHWHDRVFPDGRGMVVSAEHVIALWDALAHYDEVRGLKND